MRSLQVVEKKNGLGEYLYVVRESVDVNGVNYYNVQLGDYKTEEEAIEAMEKDIEDAKRNTWSVVKVVRTEVY